MSGFAREALAASRGPGRWIVPSKLGSNASRAHADWAASACKIHFGTGLADSQRRKARTAGAIVRSAVTAKKHLTWLAAVVDAHSRSRNPRSIRLSRRMQSGRVIC